MQKVRIHAASDAIKRDGRIIMGRAAPFGVPCANPPHPIITKGALRNPDDVTLPLFLNHDFNNKVGRVLKVWEGEDGVYFLADVEVADTNLPSHVSISADALADPITKEVKEMYIYEITLTDKPAYPLTNYTIVAMEATEKLQEAPTTAQQTAQTTAQVKVKAQEEAILNELALLREKVAALEAQVQDLLAFKDEVMQQMQAAQDAARVALDELTNVQASLKNALESLHTTIRAELDGELAQVISKLVNILKLTQTIK